MLLTENPLEAAMLRLHLLSVAVTARFFAAPGNLVFQRALPLPPPAELRADTQRLGRANARAPAGPVASLVFPAAVVLGAAVATYSQGRTSPNGAGSSGIQEPRRRQALGGAAAAALLSSGAFWPGAAAANTMPDLMEPTEGFNNDEAKRAAFRDKNKKFKKAWRQELGNLEFSTNDAEAVAAMRALTQLIKENGGEIPEGVRKQDLDQIYQIVKPNLEKDARLEFLKLDQVVRNIVTVKKMDSGDPFEFN
jgi:hypothetical protein